MARIHYQYKSGQLGAALTSGGTTITFTTDPVIATLVAPDIVAITIDPGSTSEETVYLTAYTSGALTGTIARGKDGTTGVAHANAAPWEINPRRENVGGAADAPFSIDGGTVTGAALAATLNTQSGTVTTESLTTAAGSDVVYVVTNSQVAATSRVFCTLQGGSNTTLPVYLRSVVPGAGSFTVNLRNAHASAALNGTLIFQFLVLP